MHGERNRIKARPLSSLEQQGEEESRADQPPSNGSSSSRSNRRRSSSSSSSSSQTYPKEVRLWKLKFDEMGIDLSERLISKLLENRGLRTSRCPKCHGGQHRENAFWIGFVNGDERILVLTCHRKTCGYKNWVRVTLKVEIEFITVWFVLVWFRLV